MLRKLRPRSAYDVMAAVAFFIAVAGGSAYAAATITGADVVDESLTGADIKGKSSPGFVDGTLDTYDIRNKSLLSSDVAANTLTAGELGPNSVSTSELKDGSVTFSKLAPKWHLDAPIRPLFVAGPLPVQRGFTTQGGNVLITVSGSAFRTHAPGPMGIEVLVDGQPHADEALVFTNETSSHKALVPSPAVINNLAAGSHTIELRALNPGASCGSAEELSSDLCTQTDGFDFFSASVVEIPR